MIILIVTVVTVAVVTVGIVTYFSKKQLDTLTADEMFSVQLFAILAMFLIESKKTNPVTLNCLKNKK